ncbi:MAG: hypothetical protein AAF358_05310 [Pseudomonadota bacterium]
MTPDQPELKMDAENLYKEEVFSDQRLGTIRKMTPVNADGEIDSSRDVQFIGAAQLMTPAGPLPLNFVIEADSLTAAVEAFGDHAQQALDQTMEELKELRRQQQSSIVVPQVDPTGGLAGGPPGGKIQMP